MMVYVYAMYRFNHKIHKNHKKVSLTGFPTASLRRGDIPGLGGLEFKKSIQ
jgi:hypothetical protein